MTFQVLILHDTGNTGPGDVIAAGDTDLTLDAKYNAPTMSVRTDAVLPIKTFSDSNAMVTHWDGVSAYSEVPKSYNVDTRSAKFNVVTKLYDISVARSNPIPFLVWGVGGLFTTTATRYMAPGFNSDNADTEIIEYDLPRAGTLRKMFIRCRTAGGNGNHVVYTVIINGVPTALSVSLASDVTAGSNITTDIDVNEGASIRLRVTKGATIGSSPEDVICAIQYA